MLSNTCKAHPILSSGQDTWLSPRRPGFNSRYGNGINKQNMYQNRFVFCQSCALYNRWEPRLSLQILILEQGIIFPVFIYLYFSTKNNDHPSSFNSFCVEKGNLYSPLLLICFLLSRLATFFLS